MSGLIISGQAGFADLKRRVLDYDPAEIGSSATDFCFDFASDACFHGGRPAVGAAVTAGVRSVAIVAGGTGGVEGTYPLVFAGGGGGGAAGTATVVGGAVTQIAITNPGSGYTTAPAVTVPASGVFAPNLQASLATLRNLARGANSVLGRAGDVYAVWNDVAQRPVRAGNGLRFLAGAYNGFAVQKDDVAKNRVGEPTLEGFIDELLLVTMRPLSFPALSSPLFAGRADAENKFTGIVVLNTNGNYGMVPGSGGMGTWTQGFVAGQLYQFGRITRYNVSANTTAIYPVRDGMVSGSAIVGRTPSQYASNLSNAGFRLGGGGTSGPVVFDGYVYRAYREMIGLNGLTNDDCAAKVAREWAYAQGAFG